MHINTRLEIDEAYKIKHMHCFSHTDRDGVFLHHNEACRQTLYTGDIATNFLYPTHHH